MLLAWEPEGVHLSCCMLCVCRSRHSCRCLHVSVSDSDCCDAQRSDGRKRTVRAQFHVGTWERHADKHEATKCVTSKLSQRGWENKWMNLNSQTQRPPALTWASHFFPSTLPSCREPTSLSQPVCSWKLPPPPPTKHPDRHAQSPPPTHTHTYISTPPVNQRPGCHAVTDTVGEKRNTKYGRKRGPQSLYHALPPLPSTLGDITKKNKERVWGEQVRSWRQRKRVKGLLERSGCRGDLKYPHFLTGWLHKEPGGTLNWGGGVFFFLLPGPPFKPYPPNSLRSPLRWPCLNCFPLLCQIWLLLTG